MFREYLHRAYQSLTRGRKRRAPKITRTCRPAAARLAVEGLEDRTLLSTLTLSGGALIYAQSANVSSSLTIDWLAHRYDFFDTSETITLVGSFISPSGNHTREVSFGDGNISSIVLNLGNQAFTVEILKTLSGAPVTVNMGNGTDVVNVSPAFHHLNDIQGPITIHPGLGTDSLNVNDSADGFPHTYSLGANSVSRSGAAPITYGFGINFVTIFAGNGNNTFNVSGTEGSFATTLNTGNGHNTVNVDGTGVSGTFTINEGSGGDDVNLGANVHNLDNLHGIIQVNGNSFGVDNLTVDDQANSASPTVTLDSHSISRTGAGFIQYNNLLNNISVLTGTGGATVNVLGTSRTTSIVGHANGTVNVGNAGSVQQILAPLTISDPPVGAFVTVNVDDSADGTPHTVTLDTVTISGSDYGRITGLAPAAIRYKYLDTSTVNVQTGTGGGTINVLATGKPTAIVGHANGTVNVGSAGSVQQIFGPLTITDPPAGAFVTVNVDDSADLTARIVTLDTAMIGSFGYGRITGLAPAAIQYRYIDTTSTTIDTGPGGATLHAFAVGKPVNLVGNPNAGTVTLVGHDANNTWNLTGHNAGTLNSSQSAATLTFSNVQDLSGGPGANTFVFADGAGVDGTMDGGGGPNTLNYSSYSTSVLVDLQTGSATGVSGGIVNIQNVTGGTGGGAGVYNILIGNGGNVLTGGDGRRNLLIAGATASTLVGGNDDDILIGGTTAYDTEAGLASLQAIMNYWSSTTDDYATRVGNLLSGTGVLLLDATVVHNNGGDNTLMGNHGGAGEMNLFFGLDPTMETTDYNPAIGEQFINC
jgi:hypothetical protein